MLGLVDFAIGAVAQLADHVPELFRVAVHPHIVVHLLLLGVTAAEVQHLLDVREERHRAGSEREVCVVRELASLCIYKNKKKNVLSVDTVSFVSAFFSSEIGGRNVQTKLTFLSLS